MFNLLHIGDPHFRGTNPENRIDDYKIACIDKMQEVYELAVKYNCVYITCAGDLTDVFTLSDAVKNEFADLIDASPVPILTVPGNHELSGYNLESYNYSSLKILHRMSKKLTVVSTNHVVICENPKTQITFTPYSGRMDVDGYGYNPEMPQKEGYFNIQISHGMAVSHIPPFDRYSLLTDIKTYADLIITGHDHHGYGHVRRDDGKVFCNDGSLTRIKASKEEIERQIKVTLITVGSGRYTSECGTDFDLRSIPIMCAKPGNEVLDRSKIEEKQQREYAMEQFTALVKTGASEKASLNIDQVIDHVAKKQAFAPEVVSSVLNKIEACKLKRAV